MILFSYLLRSSRRAFLLAVAASVVSGATGAAFIAVVNQALGHPADASAALILAFTALCLVTVVTRFVSQHLLFRLSQGVLSGLRRRLVDDILGARLRTVEKIGTAPLYSALSDDVVVIADALPGLPIVCSSVAFTIVCLVYLVIVSPTAALATLVAVVVGVVVYRLFSSSGLRALAAAREQQDLLFEHFRGVTEGIKELKLNRRRREVLAGTELNATADSYRRHSVVGLSVFEGAAASGQAVFFGLIGVLLFVLPAYTAISAKTLTDSVLVVLFLVSSLQGGLTWLPMLGRASVALGTIEERIGLLRDGDREDGDREEGDRDDGVREESANRSGAGASPDWSRLQLCGVSHRYPGPAGEEFVLGPLDLEFRRGEIVFVVGANGSGKSTLGKVLTGLYPPERGAIRVDGTEVTAANRDAYRQHFSAVFADFFLFDSLLGLPDGGRAEKARHHLKRLALDHKVAIVGDRFSTTALSQGQRKRLALLAAYLEDRPCCLFDEWAADQDPMFKEFFYTELLAELKAGGRMVIVISHDDRYFHVADRVIRLDQGQIRQEENPDEQLAVSRTGAEPAR
ncbi:cyclic peptide transporter [Frankia torreyi]|uniref:Cyclic peptide transporter n=2 Tax=Frankia TaxID=1854 RepID=A0A0D8BFH4_9ACTN|nr:MULTISPECIES: cyclic peptide export ABC transporter [Frankia]KJE23038.1 cyclic peptide transporter [Frankia torreyi]